MRTRAILIGIERYETTADVGSYLPGTLDNLGRFRAWLEARNPNDLECIEATGTETLGPPASHVIQAFGEAVDRWRNAYDELFVYVAGHGFSFKPLPYLGYADALACADFTKARLSGRACVNIQEMQAQLRGLGPGTQHWFVEVCRVVAVSMQVAQSGLVVDANPLGQPVVNTLFATRPGQLQDVGPSFNAALVAGLTGEGRAKARDGADWVVNMQQLAEYVGDRMQEDLQRPAGPKIEDGSYVLVKLDHVEPRVCRVEVVDGPSDASYRAEVKSGQQLLQLPEPNRLTRGTLSLSLEPGDYCVDVIDEEDRRLAQIEPSTDLLDLFDDAHVRFSAEAPRDDDPDGVIAFHGVGPTRVRVYGRLGRAPMEPSGSRMDLPPGRYVADLRDAGGTVVRRAFSMERRGETPVIDFGRAGLTPAHDRLAHTLGGQPDKGLVFSESVGIIDNRDLSVWLGMIGAGRVLRHGRLTQLPDVSDALGRDGRIVVVSALEGEASPYRARWLHEDASTDFELDQDAGLPLAFGHLCRPAGGGVLVLGDHEARLALATVVRPDRVTLVTLAKTPDDELAIRQLILPPYGSRDGLAPEERLSDPPMAHVKFSLEAQARVLGGRPLAPEDLTSQGASWAERLARGDWLDPVMSVWSAVESLRAGASQRGGLRPSIDQLEAAFGDLPDVSALNLVVNPGAASEADWPSSPPLVRELFAAVQARARGSLRWQQSLPNDIREPSRGWTLDASSPWTLWWRS